MSGLVGACCPRTSKIATPRSPSSPSWWVPSATIRTRVAALVRSNARSR